MEELSLIFWLLDSSSSSLVPSSSVPSAYCLVPSTPCPPSSVFVAASPFPRVPLSIASCPMLYVSFATDNGLLTTDA